MGLFTKKIKKQDTETKLINFNSTKSAIITAYSAEEPAAAAPVEEWIWVEGYKGTDKNMQAHGGFQYELGVEYNVAEPEEVSSCNYGYHFCLELDDVYKYFNLETLNNRFFRVRALVRKKDVVRYGQFDSGSMFTVPGRLDKLAARTIILTEEITDEAILVKAFYTRHSDLKVLPDEYNHSIIEKGYQRTYKEYHRQKLIDKGYSETFTNLLIDKYSKECVNRALVIADQEGVSMDMKIWFIFAGGDSSGR